MNDGGLQLPRPFLDQRNVGSHEQRGARRLNPYSPSYAFPRRPYHAGGHRAVIATRAAGSLIEALMTETDEVEEPQIPAALVLRRTARLWDTAHHRDAYVSRGRAR